jgi:hypothetical protein
MSMGCVISTKVLDRRYWDDGSSDLDRTNSQDALREDLSRTFAEFDVTAEIQG